MGTPDDIAIIGMAATFAGARDVETYWSNILDKVDAIRDAPPDWIGDDASFDPDCTPESLRIYTRRGGFLGDLARFDPRPFGTMPVALAGAEPDQFLAMKAAVTAIADAGYAKKDFNRERTGIILGHGIHANRANVNGIQHGLVIPQTIGLLRSAFPELTDDRSSAIEAMLRAKLPGLNVDAVPGLVPNMMTGRIANRLDFMGPNYIIDAACASSLLAIESAVSELRSGHADMMLAGGINTTTSPLVYMVFCKIGALSRNSRIRPFDKSADGTLLGEGQGIVVLKRLADALRDGDRIYAVIKGSGSASDGRAMGLMAPRLEGEILAMRRAYVNSGIDPASIGLIEAHGTGIPLGDEMEIQALTAVLGERRGLTPHIAIGSVKSMIGHCIPAAGMASVIKMALALDQKVLPPTLADEINPALALERTPFFLNTEALPWINRRDSPRRAAIDAFGFGGINTHLILEEAPDNASVPTATFGLRHRHTAELFVLAGNTREELVGAARNLAEQAGRSNGVSLRRLAADTAGRAGAGGHRLAVVATDAASLCSKLLGALDKLANPDLHRLRTRQGVFFTDVPIGGKVAFLFPGENSQYPHMLRDLALASPVARKWFDRLEGLFHGERDISHRLLLFPPSLGLTDVERRELEARLRQVDNGSESVFFADMALFTLLRALGVRPDFIVGHSTGENAAIVASGLLDASADEVDDYISRMNAIFRDIEANKTVPNGTLLTVGAIERRTIDRVLDSHREIYLTMENCRNQVILFGPTPLMAEVGAELSAQGALCTAQPFSWAYHTPFVASMADAFAKLVRDENIGVPMARLYSCASAGPFPDDHAGIRRLLREQYVSTVRFSDTIHRLYEDGARIFVEVGPAGVLTGFVDDILRDEPHLALQSDSKRGSSLTQMLNLLGQLFVHHVPLDLAPLYAEGPDVPAEPANVPVLENALPFIHLAPEEAVRLREILVGVMPAVSASSVSASVSASFPGGAIADRPRARPQPRPLSDHFRLMGDFLQNQDVVTRCAIETKLRRGEPPVSGWTGSLELPFPAAVEFVSAGSTPREMFANAVVPYLGYGDREYFYSVIGPQSLRRQREWLIGRISARRAVAAWLTATGEGAAIAEPEIEYDPEGRPILACPARNDTMFLSVSHKDDIAVAAVADRPVGIDLEKFTAQRDPDGVLHMAFSPAEAALLVNVGEPDAQLVTIAWSAKEAAAKSLGQKMLGREQSFVMTAFDPSNATVQLTHAGSTIDAFYAVDGDFVCTLAAPGQH